MNMLKVGILGVAGVLLAIQFKSGKTEYGIYISVALSLVIFNGVFEQLKYLIEMIREIENYIEIDHSYITTLLKMLGITYIADFSSAICKDAGYQAIASQIEIFGKLTVMVLSMPVLYALLNTIREFLSWRNVNAF